MTNAFLRISSFVVDSDFWFRHSNFPFLDTPYSPEYNHSARESVQIFTVSGKSFMHLAMPILAQSAALPLPAAQPLVQSLIFDALGLEITPLTTALYDVVVCAGVFLPIIS